MAHRNRAKKKAAQNVTTDPVEQKMQERAQEVSARSAAPVREQTMTEQVRSRYLHQVRAMSGLSWLMLTGAGVVLRVVLTYVLFSYMTRFAVLFANQSSHDNFIKLAQDASAENANVNTLMDQFIATSAASAAVSAVVGLLTVVIGWRLATLGWYALVVWSQDVLDAREVRREDKAERVQQVRERKEAARRERVRLRKERAGRKHEDNETETVEQAEDREKVSADA